MDTFVQRSHAFLRYVVHHTDNPMISWWGAYRSFDVYALAHFALRERMDKGWHRLRETLDMIDLNLADEHADASAKWHLADFALHPLLRMHILYRDAGLERDREDAAMWGRFEQIVRGFIWHFGDLSENHNLLHIAARYLAARRIEGLRFADGRSAEEHRARARLEILRWVAGWIERGTTEWGADIYYNVNLLSLLNLHDFADEPEVREAAKAAIEMIMLDEAVQRFGGSMMGSARRSYGCYRVDGRVSPSRPLQYLYWGDGGEAVKSPFNLHFIGGVIEAATSAYRPSGALAKIATSRQPFEADSTHLVGLWSGGPFQRTAADPPAEDHIGQHTYRTEHAMLSVMSSYGGRGRYTEHVWQATLGDGAVIFSNHPGAVRLGAAGPRTTGELVDLYEGRAPPSPSDVHPFWVVGNMPPGSPGDMRPGFWQGNECGPRSYGQGATAWIVYDILADAQVKWVHLFLPRREFDEVVERNGWIAARKGRGYVGVWCSASGRWTTRGTWKDTEYRVDGPRVGILAHIGDERTDGSFAQFAERLARLEPKWDDVTVSLSSADGVDGRITLDYVRGPLRDGTQIDTKGDRFSSPWGRLALGARDLSLEIQGERFNVKSPAVPTE